MKNVHFHFTFPSKHVIVTNYSVFATLLDYINNVITYAIKNSHIYDDTHLQHMTCRINLIEVVKVVDLDTNRIYSCNNHMIGMDKISSSGSLIGII